MIEHKVRASTYAAAAATVAMHLLGQLPFVAGMPAPVKAALGALVTAAAAFTAGYLARHTDRPDLAHEPRHAADAGNISPVAAVVIAFFGVLVLVLLLKFV